jgi:hypothetical protein
MKLNGIIKFETLHDLAEFLGEMQYLGMNAKFNVEHDGTKDTLIFL